MARALWHRRTNRGPKRSGPPAACRLQLESMEERELLTVCTVIDLGDAGSGSGESGDLRYCIQRVNELGGLSNRIDFQPDLAGTIELSGGPLRIQSNVAVFGPGA